MTEPRTFSRFWGKRCLGYFSWRRRRRFIHNPKVLDLITELVLSEAPDLVAITGDLVQLGSVEEIKEAASWLRQLSKETKVFVVPGNHDVYVKSSVKLIREFWGPYIHLVDNSFPGVLRLGPVALIGLSSAYPAPFWSAAGMVKSEQLKRIRRIVAECGSQFVCLLLHHPLATDGVSRRKQLKDVRKLQREFLTLRANLILHGHLHANKEYELGSGLPVFCTASASSADKGSPASYRVIDFNSDKLGVEVSSVLKILDLDQGVMRNENKIDWRCDFAVARSNGTSI